MPKKRAKKELDKELLSRIEKEMAEPHIAKSAREIGGIVLLVAGKKE